MASQQAAQQVAKVLGTVGRWGVILGVGGSALQASLYTGALLTLSSACLSLTCLPLLQTRPNTVMRTASMRVVEPAGMVHAPALSRAPR